MSNKKVSAVWMDNNHAFIIATPAREAHGKFEVLENITCDDHDGAGYKNERVEQSRDDQEQKKYFKAIATHVDEDASIYIFGPGKAQEQFKNFLEDYQNFNSKEIKLGSSDKLSKAEMVEAVEKYFAG